LNVTWDGDNLHVAAPRLHFLTGKPLERLRDGATVVFLSQLTVFADSRTNLFRRTAERLVMSYDLWEERFAVTRLGTVARSKSHLTAEAAESWCLESLLIASSGMAPDRLFWLRFEMRAPDAKELSTVVRGDGISITGLIEMFSRNPGPEEPHWALEAGPLRLSELARAPVRSARNG
jgi:hypothetical protein